jgi:anti-sigma regulatory factor (Ser/Thr protein kinase)
VTQYVRRRFTGSPDQVREARQFFLDAVAGRLGEPLRDEVVLVVSELASNAVQHAGTDFEVVVETDGHVRIEVEDESIEGLVRRATSAGATSGRGLPILDAVCDDWGIHVTNGHKCVWCERTLDPDLPDRSP